MESLLTYKQLYKQEELSNNEDSSTVTFAKWAGGKTQLISQLKPLFPKEFERYFEPFAGSGAVFFYIVQNYKIKYAMLSDINKELIDAYKVIKDNVNDLIKILRKHVKKHTITPTPYYYRIRSQEIDLMSAAERAARFIYLNKTCYNGLYRVNAKGKFNVPLGKLNGSAILQQDKLSKCADLLQKTILKRMSFENVLKYAHSGDFVYFDPPYYPEMGGGNFTSYQKDKFLEEGHQRLFEVFKKLDAEGCLCMLSNSNTKFIKDLYKDYCQSIVKARRMINCNGNGRNETEELVITNYN